ncbi:urea ABC transporter permease [Terrilactibacillus sp. BCM23-1]|uniref:Urea ABC transporter permease n=1 Tax=Terrilactibacillus tamarindi TaxID=2599694 RepID=A0A6N8CVA9_9BACI|nr:urea ABC transporter permease [Terrilactibacillus tamarindi]MTT32186.1 urea ABC transporter permease [Terrilactibacillus tamarindi]
MTLKTENVVAVLLFIGLFIYPLFVNPYQVMNLSYFLSMVFLSLSLALIWGYCGIFSFGQAVFFGVGGYFYAIFTMNSQLSTITPIGFILGILAGGVVAWILGYFMFYGGVNDVFVGLITLCLTLVLETFMGQTAGSEWKIGQVGLGGFNGINGIPTLQIGSLSLTGNNFYYFVLMILLIVFGLLKFLTHSKFGSSVIAIRENRDRTRLLGYNVPKIQSFVFAIGGALASLSGILYASWGSYITPSVFGLTSATIPVILVAAGGRKNFTASVIFTLLYYWFSQALSASGNQFALIILGLTLILAILFVPDGIVVALFNWCDHLFSRNKGKVKLEKGNLHEEKIS